MPPRFSLSLLSAFRTIRSCNARPEPLTRPCLRQPSRLASQFPFNGGRRSQYNRFDRARQTHNLWQNSPLFRNAVLVVGVAGSVFYVYNLETVPLSGRRRFNCVSEETERQQARSAFQQVMQQFGNQILPPDHPDSRIVEQVMRRLIPSSGLGSEGWEVRVIGDPKQQNAFVLPGGKVFVFSGILPICKDEEGLAAVLGHEISHNIAHHSAEKMSKFFLIVAAIQVAGFLFGIDSGLSSLFLDFLVDRPGSRQMETEADQLGLLMMAKSCYDPQKAVEFWQRMAKAEQYAPPQWASTHPSSKNRILAIQNWVPEAEQARQNSGCGMTSGYMEDFNQAFQQDPPRTRRPRVIVQQPVDISRETDDDDFF